MTLSRRDEFAILLMTVAFETLPGWTSKQRSDSVIGQTDKLISELDRTAPKPERSDVQDDGREIVDAHGFEATVERAGGLVFVGAIDEDGSGKAAGLTLFKARLFANRILKLCTEIEDE